jgi:hypothetical protein
MQDAYELADRCIGEWHVFLHEHGLTRPPTMSCRRTSVIERGYEGYAAQDEASVYEGGRTRRWLKVKQKDWTVEEDHWRRRISVAPPAR